MRLPLLALALSSLSFLSSVSAATRQSPLKAKTPVVVQTARLSDLSSSSLYSDSGAEGFASFKHPSFPKHGLRIKKVHDFCDTTVNAYSGFLDFASSGSKHMFFWFFESRSKPEEDDVIMWINGGPGGSSAMGAFFELGPCSINQDADPKSTNRTTWNPYGWNTHANVFFLEQPVNVGWSYADDGATVSTTPDAARDVEAFISIFFDVFDEFKGRAFHIAGESYGGRYVPIFASAVYDGAKNAVEEGRTPVNLSSVMIGNGFTHPVEVVLSVYDMLCTTATGHPPWIPIEACVELRKIQPFCREKMYSACVDRMDITECDAYFGYCEGASAELLAEYGLNPYDLRQKCKSSSPACYSEMDTLTEWLNMNSTRKTLGLPDSVPAYDSINFDVNRAFTISGDIFTRSDYYVAQLLERGIRVLAFIGVTDSACPWTANKRTYDGMDWSGAETYASAPTREWSLSSSSSSIVASSKALGASSLSTPNLKVGGTIRSAEGLTFMTVNEAGHMVPYDKPKEALAMVDAWLKGTLV